MAIPENHKPKKTQSVNSQGLKKKVPITISQDQDWKTLYVENNGDDLC